MFRISAHLQRHPSSGIFYFRIAIPTRLRDTLGKREIKKSLGTGVRAEAIVEAQRLYVKTHDLFRRTEKRMAPQKSKSSPANDLLSILNNMPVSPDGSIQKTVITVAGQKVTIDRENPTEEAQIAAELLRLVPVVWRSPRASISCSATECLLCPF